MPLLATVVACPGRSAIDPFTGATVSSISAVPDVSHRSLNTAMMYTRVVPPGDTRVDDGRVSCALSGDALISAAAATERAKIFARVRILPTLAFSTLAMDARLATRAHTV